MKKYKNFGLLVLALFFALPAAAQLGEERHNFAVGINGGLNMSSVSFNPKNQTEHLEHHVYGGYHEIYVREIFQDDVWRANGNKLFTTRMGRKDRR